MVRLPRSSELERLSGAPGVVLFLAPSLWVEVFRYPPSDVNGGIGLVEVFLGELCGYIVAF